MNDINESQMVKVVTDNIQLNNDEESILREELGLLLEIQQGLLLESAEDKEDPVIKNQYTDIIEIRDSLSEARTEDLPALMAQMERMVLLKYQQQTTAKDSFIDPQSPYFGHMKLSEEGKIRNILVGSGNCFSSHLPCPIVDWRQSPISKIFYKYREGDEYVEDIGDREVEGELISRRLLFIEDGRLQRITWGGNTLEERNGHWVQNSTSLSRLKGGSGIASRPFEEEFIDGRLGRSKAPKNYSVENHLKQITALIDPKQFELISHTASGVILIQGGAGSGKTTVALHRMSYLISKNPGYFQPSNVMPVVFGPALANYIGKVLPSLGIRGVKPQVYQKWVSRLRMRLFPRLPYDYAENTPVAVIQFKRHPFILKWFKETVKAHEIDFQEKLFLRCAEFKESGTINKLWYLLAPYPLVNRLKRLLQWTSGNQVIGSIIPCSNSSVKKYIESLIDDCFPNFEKDPEGLVTQIWNDAMVFRENIFHAAQKHAPEVFTDGQLQSIWSWSVRQYQKRFEEDKEERFTLRHSVVREFSSQGVNEESQFQDDVATLDEEDDTLLLLLYQMLVGSILRKNRKPLRYTHLMIDEAQDFSPLELQLLINLSPRDKKSITLAGDMDQRILLGNRHEDWESVLGHLSVDVQALDPLTVGYRSTNEIMSVARSVIGKKTVNTEWRAIRHGAPVERFAFKNQGSLLLFLSDALEDLQLREPNAIVAVLTREMVSAKKLYEGLMKADIPNLRLISNQEFSFSPGIEVTEIAQTKGLEFDYVILTDTDASTFGIDDTSRHLLYVAVTRAAHQLWLLHHRKPSELLPEILTSTI